MNYQELANENLFKHNFGVCDESPPKSHLRQRFYRGDWWHVCSLWLSGSVSLNIRATRRSPPKVVTSQPDCYTVSTTFVPVLLKRPLIRPFSLPLLPRPFANSCSGQKELRYRPSVPLSIIPGELRNRPSPPLSIIPGELRNRPFPPSLSSLEEIPMSKSTE